RHARVRPAARRTDDPHLRAPDDRGIHSNSVRVEARRRDPREVFSMTTSRLTPVQWLICAIASIGFAFDIYEILMLPLIVRPALLELTGAAQGRPQFRRGAG